MSGSRSLQRAIRVSYLGPKYSYSHLASVAKFGEAVEHVPVGSIAAVFEEVNRRHVQFGLVPLENSTDGRVADTLDMFIKLPNVKIRAEVRLRFITVCWAAAIGARSAAFIPSRRHFLNAATGWARTCRKRPRSRLSPPPPPPSWPSGKSSPPPSPAAPPPSAYRLDVLAENIEDQPHNVTRFAVIGERAEERTGRDKTTLMIRLPNQAGSLAKMITPFEKFGVNMTWIESFPIPGSGGGKGGETNPSYLFFVDVEGYQTDKAVQSSHRHGPQTLRAARHHRLLPKKQLHRELKDLSEFRKGDPGWRSSC